MFDLKDENILNVYKFGSHVYGSNNEDSDEDYIIVVKEYIKSDSIDHHYHTLNNFKSGIESHDIQCLECLFLKDEFILKEEVKFDFKLNLEKLRCSISTVSNGSWIKGMKKLTANADYDKKLAIKSLFHSLRIRDFGIQIAEEGKIYNYSSMNYMLIDLIKLSNEFESVELWNKCKDKYESLYKKMRSDFILLCPKPKNHKKKKENLKRIFIDFGLEPNDDLFDRIIHIIGK